ncbi:MAG TPA: helix-turn-helix domain-containing protein [Ktedonobacteraceae bacterium]|nr:helix-turn-helix domain-containing protein [Ktedonobacteraceae bacterium]
MSKERRSTPLPNERLKQERLSRGWTQTDVAGFIGTDGYTVNRWERGKARPRPYFCQKLCELFGKSALDLGLVPALQQNSFSTTPSSIVRLPVSYWRIPSLRNPFFTGREAFLEMLHAYLLVDQAVTATQPYALYGLGGIGKSQLAAEYAYRYATAYQAVFWINAENPERMMASYLAIAEFLQLPECLESEQPRLVRAVHRWLITHNKWLLIWDNLEDLELLQRFLPPVRQGAILITTRKPALGCLAFPLELPLMMLEKGAWLLLRRARILHTLAQEEQIRQFAAQQPATYAAALELATLLGGLPLALDQAGAYIEETRCTISDYVQRYKQQRALLLDRRGASGGDHPHSVAATFKLSYQRVIQEQPLAAYLLCLCVFLCEEGIPEELFAADATQLGLTCNPLVADLFITNPYRLDLAIATLRNLSLVKRHPETKTLSIHPLVQAVLQDAMNEKEHILWQQRVIKLLNIHFPEATPATWNQCERFLPHVLPYSIDPSPQLYSQELGQLLQKAANYLHARAQYKQSEMLYQRVLYIMEQIAEPEHPLVDKALQGLALLYAEQGEHAPDGVLATILTNFTYLEIIEEH